MAQYFLPRLDGIAIQGEDGSVATASPPLSRVGQGVRVEIIAALSLKARKFLCKGGRIMKGIKMQAFSPRWLLALAAMLVANSASAHTGVLSANGFGDGLAHPFLGVDHLLVMLGVGLWASAQRFGRAALVLALFLAGMAAGALLGLAGMGFAEVETGIFVSLLLFGLALASGKADMPLPPSLLLVAASATLHGLAHGGEMPQAAAANAYLLGMVVATGLLHALGLGLGLALRRANAAGWLRVYGGLTGIVGAWLLFAA